MAKLHVPPPEGADDRSDVNLAMLASVLLFILAGIFMVRAAEHPPEAAASKGADGDVPHDIHDELNAQRQLARKVGRLEGAKLQAKEWTDEERIAVLRFGPRAASETICADMMDQIRNDELTREMRIELQRTLERRAEFAPWTCMTRLFLERTIPPGILLAEMMRYWDEIVDHRGKERIPISVLEDFREARERPQNPGFYHWLRLCALDFDYQVHPECQKMLYQMAPEQGADLLDVIEHHWTAIGTLAEDMPTIIAALGYLARNGQPHSFKVTETESLPDYDVDFRQAAVGYLCRMMNTPTPTERSGIAADLDPVPQLAGEQLRKVGLVGARAYEEKLLMRWREACRIAFGGGYNEERTEMTPVPLLAVWDGDPASSADFRISKAIELGTCQTREGYPRWWCLADQWKDEERTLDAAVAHAFIRTRYMEWEKAFDTSDEPEEEKKPQPKPTEKTEPEPEPQPKPKPKPAEEAKPESKPTPKPTEEAKPEPEPEPETEPKPTEETKPETKPKPVDEAKPEPPQEPAEADEADEADAE